MALAWALIHYRLHQMVESCLSVQEKIEWACLLEATAEKLGNVTPTYHFEDLFYEDFVNAAAITAASLSDDCGKKLGLIILETTVAVQQLVGKNVNLGIVLLLAPIVMAARNCPQMNLEFLRASLDDVLKQTTIEDACDVYKAIRMCAPGGMGRVCEQDLSEQPTVTLLETMHLAADRDQIAAQYATSFQLVFDFAQEHIEMLNSEHRWQTEIILLQLSLLSCELDTLIVRKNGIEVAEQVRRRAVEAYDAYLKSGRDCDAVSEFDRFLRSQKNRLNPGTTADLIAAIVFVIVLVNDAPRHRDFFDGFRTQLLRLTG